MSSRRDHRRRRRRSRSRVSLKARLVAALVVMAVLIWPVASYADALTAPGEAPWQIRSVDWLRDHGGAPLINTIENWYYSRAVPADGIPASSAVPTLQSGPSPALPADASRPGPLPVLPGHTPLPGEAHWQPGQPDAHGVPLLYRGWFRPDLAHSSVAVGVAWIRQSGTTAHLVAGTAQPGGTGWPGTASIPPADAIHLLATFNSGWRMDDITGGFYLAGHTGQPLRRGQATATINDRGHLDVGQWGRDMTMGPHLVAARQNLDLIVDRGRPVPDLTLNAHGQWGSPRNQFQYTNRSGLGIDAHGNLIYVAGLGLNLDALAAALTDAGAVRGMELDIHPNLAFFAAWQVPALGRRPIPAKLLPSMDRPADRYLAPDQRDFFYLTVGRPGVSPG